MLSMTTIHKAHDDIRHGHPLRLADLGDATRERVTFPDDIAATVGQALECRAVSERHFHGCAAVRLLLEQLGNAGVSGVE